MSDARRFEIVRDAIERGERDARLLDGRCFNARYWRNVKQALTNIERNYGRAESERDAFRAVAGE